MAITSPIAEYNPRWLMMYEEEKSSIKDMLGNFIVDIHHIGSTAIPGIKAKPEIDILIVVKSVTNIDGIDTGMETLGYRCRGECLDQGGTRGRFYYSKDTDGKRTHKAHVCQACHCEIPRKLAFRNYMRNHSDEADKYSKLKLALELHNRTGMAEYLTGKNDYIEGIISFALREGYGKEPYK